MPVLETAGIMDILRCPCCKSRVEMREGRYFCTDTTCLYDKTAFEMIGNQPVLVDFGTSVFKRATYAGGKVPIVRPLGLAGRLLDRIRESIYGPNRPAEAKAAELIARLSKIDFPRVLVVGGGTAGSGTRELYAAATIDIVGLDVFPTELTTLVADGHKLPFAAESFDAVWIQAVLEHVLDPQACVAEIHRVLKPDGFVYADTPFMQQVHGGAFDFHRFSLNGHRWLFRNFAQIEAGVVGGAGVSLLWSLRYFLRSFGWGNKISTLMTLPFIWLRLFDRLTSRNGNADGANGVYFLGQKSQIAMSPQDIVEYYHAMREAPRKRKSLTAPAGEAAPGLARR
jgi:SAM-dependent methyltransferase